MASLPVTALWVARAARAAIHAWSQPSSALDTPEPPICSAETLGMQLLVLMQMECSVGPAVARFLQAARGYGGTAGRCRETSLTWQACAGGREASTEAGLSGIR
jgi:hypothetical protein